MKMNWTDCLEKGLVRVGSKDDKKAAALQFAAESRLTFAASHNISAQNAPFVFVEYYEALRTLCEAIGAHEGVKFYNHECIGSFLKEFLHEEKASIVFDRARELRNRINYYGAPFSAPEAVKQSSDIAAVFSELLKKN